jgi:hypothetical protein
MWRRILISILVMLLVGGAFVWFSLTPEKQVNLQASANLDAIAEKLAAGQSSHLPVSFNGDEVKALAVKAIQTAGIDDRIKGVDVELRQDSLAVSLAVDAGVKVLAVSAEVKPVLSEQGLTLDLSNTKIGVVPVPVDEVWERLGEQLPAGVSLSAGQLSVDLQQVDLSDVGLSGLRIENGSLVVQPK